ncbi:MAG TPA: hypothetical protein VKM55_00280 [Candidatus Lokiarchaeia archaeon]|nr:hypothetical protein [Candidatus Lokiarchaeia archaeon]
MDENGLWELGAALMQVQGAILRMEEHATDPAIVRDLATAALDAGQELEAVLSVLAEKLDVEEASSDGE